jgi:hypothetical protein
MLKFQIHTSPNAITIVELRSSFLEPAISEA